MSDTVEGQEPGPNPASLERRLGLYAVFTISIGAMIGSGIFVLPGVASKLTGPSVILAFFLAGIVVLPAAFSKSEMATAMPEAGGTYLYIDRAMGPLMGTIAGIGVWFSLVFKAAFALVGLGAYLTFFFDVNDRLVALVLAGAIIVLNLVGVKATARFQTILVSAVLFVLVLFTLRGFPAIDPTNFDPFFTDGLKGLLSATGVVFVAYIGVTKVTSIAEEVREPERNIPTSILLSVGVAMVLYPAIVTVIVGVTPADELASTTTPIATAAEHFLGRAGVVVAVVTAVAALVSMANAGVVAAARYPFAMSRNSLAPSVLRHIGARSGAPTFSIAVTGALLLLLIAFVPLLDLAKLASAFQLLIFALVNLALIAFREARLDWYQPSFRSPLYPAMQIFGIVAGLLLLTQMGLIPTIGAVLFILVGGLWYRSFGQARAVRESAARDALRARADDRLVELSRATIADEGRRRILIAVRRPTTPARQRTLYRLAIRLVRSPGGEIHIIHFGDQVPGDVPTTDDLAVAADLGIEVTVERLGEVSRRGAVHAHVENEGADLFIADMPQDLRATRHIVRDLRWLRDHLTCDSLFLRNRPASNIETIVVMGTGGPYDPVKIGIAHRLAVAGGATIRFVHVTPEDATQQQSASVAEYHERLGESFTVPWESRIAPAEGLVETLTRLSRGASLVILGAPSHRFHLVADLADRLAESVDCPALLVHTPEHERPNWIVRQIEHLIS